MEFKLKENEVNLIFCADAIWFYIQRCPQSNPRIVYELKIFVAAKHTLVHHFKI